MASGLGTFIVSRKSFCNCPKRLHSRHIHILHSEHESEEAKYNPPSTSSYLLVKSSTCLPVRVETRHHRTSGFSELSEANDRWDLAAVRSVPLRSRNSDTARRGSWFAVGLHSAYLSQVQLHTSAFSFFAVGICMPSGSAAVCIVIGAIT